VSPALLRFRGGLVGAFAPFVLFLAGVAALGISGAPDERGFWPVLLAALTAGLLLARDRKAWSDALLRGMSQPIVMIMVLAWLLAGVLGTLLAASGLVEALVWLARAAHVQGAGFVAAAFLVCCVMSTATGTSLGTLLVCGPLLYPAGGAQGADPAFLIGAILAGATFGDSLSPISDTTIASAMTQEADIGGVVRARLKYALPAAGAALLVYALAGGGSVAAAALQPDAATPRGLPMLAVPAFVVALLLRRRELVEGLLFGILAAVGLGLALRLLAPERLLYVDAARFSARGLVVDGMERGVGISVFTILLMGLVATIEATGALDRLVDLARRRTRSARGAEMWIVGAVSAAVLLTTHSIVAILAVGAFAKETGRRFGLSDYRRANLLDLTVCTYPFLLPYFIPTLLAATTSASGAAGGMPRISPFAAGFHNFYSWMLLAIVAAAVVTGFGRGEHAVGPGAVPAPAAASEDTA
jgi:Na+/H+ antiporter NhaC